MSFLDQCRDDLDTFRIGLADRKATKLLNITEDLLEALEGLLECSPCQNGCNADDMSCASNAARAAIGKVEEKA